jgi:PAS domain S-box-containing protein
MAEYHNQFLVLLSVVISVLAAYAARDLFDRIREARGALWLAWLVGAATVDGIGTWSMHYTAMLGFHLPVMVLYDWPTVLLSLLVAIAGSGIALQILRNRKAGRLRGLVAGVFMGVGISGLHYIAMKAMRLPAEGHYSAGLVTLSILSSMLLCSTAMTGIFLHGENTPRHTLRSHGSTLLRGSANPTMHYIAMAAVSFVPSQSEPAIDHAVSILGIGVFGISIVPLMLLCVVLLTALADRTERQRVLLDELFEQAPQAVALLTADNRVVRINREFTRLFGYGPRETIGSRLDELIVPFDGGQKWAELLDQRERKEVEWVIQHREGRGLHIVMVRVPVAIPGGHVEVYTMFIDTTERKQAEDALRDSADRLQVLSRRLLELQETERRHLARELHDEVGQLLTGLRLLLKPATNSHTDASKDRFEQPRAVVDQLLEKVRGLSFDLRPAVLDQLGLLPALLQLFENYTRQTGVLVSLKHKDIEGRFAPEVETTAYRIVQEALTNVARHAGVGGVTVRVWATMQILSVQIQDRGRGFDPKTVLASLRSSGLVGMRERVVLLDGELTVDAQTGEGTTITAELPLRRYGVK